MHARKIVFFLLTLAFVLGTLLTQETKRTFPVLKGPYLGQKPPGMTPEIFAPGIISTGYDERIAAFTPDGKEFYYVLYGAPHMVILYTKEKNESSYDSQLYGRLLVFKDFQLASNSLVTA